MKQAASKRRKGHEGCEVGELFQLLGRPHTLDLLYVFTQEAKGPLRFVDLQEKLGLSPNTLSDRLKALVEAGLLTRTAYNEIPPRVDYEATTKTTGLCNVFAAMKTWAESNNLRPVAPVREVAAKVT